MGAQKRSSSKNQEIQQIRNEISEDIRPTQTEKEKIRQEAANLKAVLSKPEKNLRYEPVFLELFGSTGIKQTQLRNDFDIDFFIGFPPSLFTDQDLNHAQEPVEVSSDIQKTFFKQISEEIITPRLETAGHTDIQLSYAEHPYVSSKHNGIEFDIVGCIDLPSSYLRRFGPITAIDRSPFHGRYIAQHLTESQRDDVRLLKYFFKQHHTYGEKALIGLSGFIGYAIELLVAHYGDFLGVLEHFADLKTTPIDPENRPLSYFKKNARYAADTLLILDPVDPDRNVASSIDERAYVYVCKQIAQFLANPTATFFENPLPSVLSLESETDLGQYFALEFKCDPEVHFTKPRDKLYSLGNKILKQTTNPNLHVDFGAVYFEGGFNATSSDFSLLFFAETPELDEFYVSKGPKLVENRPKLEKHINKFKKKNANVFEKDGQLFAKKSREIRNFTEVLDLVLQRWTDDEIQLTLCGPLTDPEIQGKLTPVSLKTYHALRQLILPLYLD